MRLPPRPCALAFVASIAGLAACGPEGTPPPPPPTIAPATAAPPLATAPEAPPLGRLPADARPTHYAVALRVDPARPRFEGVADIVVELDRPRDVIWLHGRDLAVHRATLKPEGGPAADVRYEQVSPSGVAALRPAAPVGPGHVTLHVEYDAPFAGNDEGLYTRVRGGDHYAYAQFEATDARRAFPCFDEPAFKAPFAVTLVVPHGLAALSNAREVSRAPEPARAGAAPAEAWDRVVFAPTERLPSYLLNFAVGPFDVVAAPDLPPSAVRHRPLPLRGVATHGRGPELAYALAHTGELVTVLETYFGSEYPYDKLDLLAVPDKSGAMENAGSLTFAEAELLIDPKGSSVDARFEFAAVVGHELAHQWFGDLVTMPWWDDLWLNEAFATWMEPRLVAAVRPELHPEMRALESANTAMAADSLVSARKIRQEIADDNDIQSAFDAITYDKGGAVLSMFERWISPERFQKGIRAYLGAHRFGTASAADLLAALSTAAGRDVAAPFRTFLDQPGLPFVDVRVVCDGKPRLVFAPSRFLPVGSSGKSAAEGPRWQIPVCARYPDGKEIRETCSLVSGPGDTMPLDTCPAWVMPNADAAGYYRWSLPPADRAKLAAALPALTERERVSFAKSLAADFASAKSPAADVLSALAPLATDPSSSVAGTAMDLVSVLARWLEGDPLHARVEAYADALLAPSYKAVGWGPKHGEAEDTGKIALRKSVITFLAFTARDKAVRKEAAARGRAYLGMDRKGHRATARDDKPVVSPDLATIALQVTAEEGGAPAFEALVTGLAAEEREIERRRLLDALGSVTDPDLAGRARALELDPRVHSNEVGRHILTQQLRRSQTRDAAWAFLTTNVDKLLARAPAAWASALVYAGTNYCDAAHRDELERLFTPRIAALEAGPRNLAGALEEMSLCVARRAAHEPSARAFFTRKK